MIPLTLDQVSHAIGADLEARHQGIRITRVVTDSREVRSGDVFFAICGPRFDGHDFVDAAFSRGAVACVCSREVLRAATTQPRALCLMVSDTVAALGRLAAYYRRKVMTPQTVVVAVTGSNGKTTTKFMLDQVLSAALPGRASPKSFNNNIGVPLSLLSVDRDDRYVILEMGTNAPGEIAQLAAMAAPDVAVITSIGEAHLEGLGTARAIAEEKASLLDHVRSRGLAVVNVDRAEIRSHLTRNPAIRLVTVGFDNAAGFRVTNVTGSVRATRCELDGQFAIQLPIPGLHHATNAAAAFVVARWFGLDPQIIAARLSEFQPPEGRTMVLEMDGVTVVDDTYNANPASVRAAIQTLSKEAGRRRVFVLGDMLELGQESALHHRHVVQAVRDARIEVLVTVGPNAGEAAGSLSDSRALPDLAICSDVESAAQSLYEILRHGDVVWVKGSRGMKLDRLVELLKSCTWEAAVA